MAYPPAYSRDYSFTDFETNNPGQPKPGPALDTEFDDVANALTATQTALALIQRADGALANGIVGEDQLDPTLFDHIADDAVADAEAAAAAAAASAGAAASSASAANGSATAAATSAATASGAAAQAGVSQGIAQDAANEAALSATDADTSADVAVQAANDTAGNVAATEAAVQRAFEWAELLTGPVLPAPPGWPEAVDDGMFSSKWWAIRARDYNSTETIDLGTAGADIGEAFDIWDAIPGNDLGPGQVYATWGTPTQTYVLIDRSNPSDPASWQNITGGPGPPGPGNSLTIGTVTTGAVGQPADATITGVSPNQVLNLTLPTGATGAQGVIGPAGPPNVLNIGTVTTVPDGTPSSATITGTSPTQTLNLVLTAGPQGIQGIQGIQGPVGPAVNLANPTGVVGLVAVNGVATTAPRSDSSPALSQAIAPTWSGVHTFTSGAGPASAAIVIASVQPTLLFVETDQAANDQYWFQHAAGQHFRIGTVDNPVTGSVSALDILRSGNSLVSLSFGNVTNNPAYNFLGTGLMTVGGNVNASSFAGKGIFLSNATAPYIWLSENNAALDGKLWRQATTGATMAFNIWRDDFGASKDWLSIVRAAFAVSSLTFGNATDNPTYTFLGTGAGIVNGPWVFSAPSSTPVVVNGATGDWAFRVNGQGALPYGALITAGNDGNAALYVRRGDAGNRNLLIVQGNSLQFGNGTDNPAYTFQGTGVISLPNPHLQGQLNYDSSVAGYMEIVNRSGSAAGLKIYHGAGGSAPITIIGADGSITLNAGIVSTGGTSMWGVATRYTSINGANGVIVHRYDDNGINTVFQTMNGGITGSNQGWRWENRFGTDGATFFPGGRIEWRSLGNYGSVGNQNSSFHLFAALNGVDTEYFVVNYGGISFKNDVFISGATTGTGKISLGGKTSLVTLDDGYLRINPDSLYGYVMAWGTFRAYGSIQCVGIWDHGGTLSIVPNVGGAGMTYGTYYVQGPVGGYHGIGVNDGGLRPIFMSDNNNAGLYVQGDSKWLLYRNGATVAISNYGLTAPSFTTSSSRDIKRETGKPSKPASILARLRPILYRLFADDDHEQLGLIAEEVNEVCPLLSDGKTVAYDRLAILLLAAWQDEHATA